MVSGDQWRLLETGGDYQRTVETVRDQWRLSETTGDQWRLLETTGDRSAVSWLPAFVDDGGHDRGGGLNHLHCFGSQDSALWATRSTCTLLADILPQRHQV